NPLRVQPRYRFGCTRDEPHILRSPHEVRVDIDRAVAVEEDGATKLSGIRRAHDSAATTASANAASSVSGTERRSSRSRSLSILPITGCAAPRNRASRTAASPSSATAADGSWVAGNDPPPTLALLDTTAARCPAA